MEPKEKKGAVVEVIENGPLRITGKINMTDNKRGINTDAQEIWLCRCGRSENKPYCDGTHKR